MIGQLEIARLRLEPGDVLVVRVDGPLSKEQADNIRARIAPLLPAFAKLLTIDKRIELSVLTRGEIEARIA